MHHDDETYALPPVNISRKEAFSFGPARKLLAHDEGTPLHLDMKAVLDKIAASLEGEVTLEPDWLSEHVDVLPEDRVRIDPDLWGCMVGFIERRECIRARTGLRCPGLREGSLRHHSRGKNPARTAAF